MININIDYILNKVKDSDDILNIKKAYEIAEKNLANKTEVTGENTLTNVLEICNILLDLNVDLTTIISALLYRCDNYEESSIYTDDVTKIVLSLKKMQNLELNDDSEYSAIYLRKVIVGLSEDVRVLFIKLAEVDHLMKMMKDMDSEFKKKISNEALDVLVPIAHRLGINSIKSDMENMALYYLKPDVYNDILEKLNTTTASLNSYLNEMIDSISSILTENDIEFEIKGRVKSVYSIYNKLNNGKKWEDIYDILALRVFVQKESDCYAVVGLIHSKYRPYPNRFKDYIATPKENMYQSLHTTIHGKGNRPYEVQIRTYEMHEIAEKGLASHWSYKEKGTKKIQNIMEQKLEIFRNEIDDAADEIEFEQTIKEDILGKLIYTFTPKGDVVELPYNATPVDFAYRIHTNVGNTMTGALVNDIMVPIDTPLKDNDVVKILTSPTGKPNKDWLNFVKTYGARSSIKSYFSKIDREEYTLKGKNLLEKEIRRKKLSINEILSDENVLKICNGLKLKDINDLYLAVGFLRYTPGFIINYVSNDEKEDALVVKKEVFQNKNIKNDIVVDGKEDIVTTLAYCCNPVKGDDIIGIITKNDGIKVHRKNCPNIIGKEDFYINVSWSKNSQNTYHASFIIKANDEKDIEDDIANVINNLNIKILSLDEKEDDYKVTVRVSDLNEIDNLIKNLYHLRYVKDVKRI